MERAWEFGSREVLAEIEAEAREGMETEGERCDWCNGSGMDGLDPRTFDPVSCPCCHGTGREEGGE